VSPGPRVTFWTLTGRLSCHGRYELAIPILCADPKMAGMVTCANVPILSIPNFNVYQQSRMTVDTRFGEYNECNPDPSSGIFKCATRDHQAGKLPPQCKAFKATADYCLNGAPAFVQKGSIAECCALATERKASLWQYFEGNTSCEIHTAYVGGSACGDHAILGSPAQGSHQCWCVVLPIASLARWPDGHDKMHGWPHDAAAGMTIRSGRESSRLCAHASSASATPSRPTPSAASSSRTRWGVAAAIGTPATSMSARRIVVVSLAAAAAECRCDGAVQRAASVCGGCEASMRRRERRSDQVPAVPGEPRSQAGAAVRQGFSGGGNAGLLWRRGWGVQYFFSGVATRRYSERCDLHCMGAKVGLAPSE
jgi:hypothetical protein